MPYLPSWKGRGKQKFTLRAGPIASTALKMAGFRVMTLANNHTMDFGPLALQETLASWTIMASSILVQA